MFDVEPLEPEHVDLVRLMEYPELLKDCRKRRLSRRITNVSTIWRGSRRIRRGKTSVTILHTTTAVGFVRRGDALSTPFGSPAPSSQRQFARFLRETQRMAITSSKVYRGVICSPSVDHRSCRFVPTTWSDRVAKRKMTEVCRMVYEACIRETARDRDLHFRQRTDNVPWPSRLTCAKAVTLRHNGVSGSPRFILLKNDFAEYAWCRRNPVRPGERRTHLA